VIGLLGAIAGGKSSAARILAALGAAVVDADAAAHAELADRGVIRALVARHGRALLRPDGTIDRAALARKTFGDPEALSHLERLVHPRVRARLERRLAALLRERHLPAVVLDVPLLLESSPLARRCDLLLYIESSAPERRRRARARRGWSAGELARRDAHQLSPVAKRRRADVVIRNDGTEAKLRRTILEWLASAGGFTAIPRRATPMDRAHGRGDS